MEEPDDDPAMVRFWTEMTHTEMVCTLAIGQRIARERVAKLMALVGQPTADQFDEAKPKGVLGRPRNRGSNTPFPDNAAANNGPQAPRGALDGDA